MKRLVLALVLVGLTTSPACAAIALVQITDAFQNSSNGLAKAYTSSVTAGSLLVIGTDIQPGNDAVTITVVSDKGETFQTPTCQQNTGGTPHKTCLYYAMNAVGGTTTITVTPSATTNIWLTIAEYSGAATTNALDQVTATQDTGACTTPCTTGNIITTVANSVIVVLFYPRGVQSLSSITSGFVLEDTVVSRGAYLDRIVTSTSTYNMSANTSGGTDNWNFIIANFAASATKKLQIKTSSGKLFKIPGGTGFLQVK